MSGAANTAAEIGRALIHGLAWSVLVATLAPSGSAVAAFFGGAVGCLVGARVARGRLRTPVIFGVAAFALVIVVLMRGALTNGSGLAAAVGPVSALRIATTFSAVLVSLVVSAALRAGSKRMWTGWPEPGVRRRGIS